MVSRLPFALLAALALLLAPASAHAAITVDHSAVDAREISGTIDDVVAPGDRISIRETIASAGAITGVSGGLLTSTPGVTIANPGNSSAYPNIGAGGTATNTNPFDAVLSATGIRCGTIIDFTLA